jgi:hypothetical protein
MPLLDARCVVGSDFNHVELREEKVKATLVAQWEEGDVSNKWNVLLMSLG